MGLEKIWGISQGEYSDYQVLCLCKSKKVAEKVAKKVNENDVVQNDILIPQWLKKVLVLKCTLQSKPR